MKLQIRRVTAILLLMFIVGPLLFPLLVLPMVPLANASIEINTETNYRTETNYETEENYETKTHEQIKFKNNTGEESNQDGTVPAPSNWDIFKYTTRTILRDLTI